MAYLEELLPEFRKGAKIRRKCWSEGMCIPSEGRFGLNFTECDARADDWEFYQQPINWQYIIDHKCLCWFWERDDAKQIKYLTAYRPEEKYPFVGYLDVFGYCTYSHCRPVRKDEVTFYEDRNNEN